MHAAASGPFVFHPIRSRPPARPPALKRVNVPRNIRSLSVIFLLCVCVCAHEASGMRGALCYYSVVRVYRVCWGEQGAPARAMCSVRHKLVRHMRKTVGLAVCSVMCNVTDGIVVNTATASASASAHRCCQPSASAHTPSDHYTVSACVGVLVCVCRCVRQLGCGGTGSCLT